MLWVLRVLQLMSAAARECCSSWVLRITGACRCGCVTLLQLLMVPVGLAVPGIPRGSPFWVRMRTCWKALGKGRRRSEGPEGRGRQNVSHFIVFPLAGFAKAPGGTLSGTHSVPRSPTAQGRAGGDRGGGSGVPHQKGCVLTGVPPTPAHPIPTAHGRKRHFLPKGSQRWSPHLRPSAAACVRPRNSSRPARPGGHLPGGP